MPSVAAPTIPTSEIDKLMKLGWQSADIGIKAQLDDYAKKITERAMAALKADFQKKYGLLLTRYSPANNAQAKAQAEARRKAAQEQLDVENAKVKATIENQCDALFMPKAMTQL
ncbi:MAG: hypothetical protein FWE82_10165 [Defluviitaleaceae bacterium]|nr:hypothetical protein [Defluviitaleaceae bacterium]